MLPSPADLFELPSDLCYLNCAYLAPQPAVVKTALRGAIDQRDQPWGIGPEDFFGPGLALRKEFAKLLGASPGSIAIVPSVSYGIETAASNIKLNKGDKIVLLADQFPSNVYPWVEVAKKKGAEIRFVSREPFDNIEERLISEIAGGARVCAISHCHWTDGVGINLSDVAEETQRSGCALVLDLTQSFGAVPCDYLEFDPDFIAVAGYKWLMGPYGVSYLYVAERHQQGLPIENNWLGRKGAEDFRQLTNYNDKLQDSAARFDVGQRSNVLIPGAIAALKLINDWGPTHINSEITKMTDYLTHALNGLGLEVCQPRRSLGHILGLEWVGDVNDVVATLREFKVFVSARGQRIRIAPHLYNSTQDLDKFVAQIKRLAKPA